MSLLHNCAFKPTADDVARVNQPLPRGGGSTRRLDPPVNLMLRAGTQAAFAAFALSGLAVIAFYTILLRVQPGDAVATAVTLALVASATVFIAVCAVVYFRLARKSPVLGAWRGAAIAVVAVAVVAAAHTCLAYGSAGFIYSLFGQIGYACLVGGPPAAIAGALLGRSIEGRVFMARGP